MTFTIVTEQKCPEILLNITYHSGKAMDSTGLHTETSII